MKNLIMNASYYIDRKIYVKFIQNISHICSVKYQIHMSIDIRICEEYNNPIVISLILQTLTRRDNINKSHKSRWRYQFINTY